ncbi:hypothetical protein HDU86_004125 [Geranomyces michiganensis]|nr:hypothetical protein HDU86_004125 [Geranomyces michiganensis]
MFATRTRAGATNILRFTCRQPPCSRRYRASPVGFVSTSPDTVWSWGVGSDGRLGHGEQVSVENPRPIQALSGCEVFAVDCGVSHTVALLGAATGGQVFSWGSNFYGQAGHIPESSGFLDEDDDDQLSIPTAVKGSLQDKDIAQIACGDFHTLSLTHSGEIYSWGAGLLGHGSEYNDSNPLPITFFADVARRPCRVAARHMTSCAVAVPVTPASAGSNQSTSHLELYAWGHLGANEKARSPVLVARALSSPLLNRGLDAIEALACGDGCVAVAGSIGDESRRVLVFGQPESGSANVTAPNYPMPRQHASQVVEVWTAPPSVDMELPNKAISKLLCGQEFGLAVHDDGETTLFAIPTSPSGDPTKSATPLPLQFPPRVRDAVITPTSLLLLLPDGQIVGWNTPSVTGESASSDRLPRKPWWRFWDTGASVKQDSVVAELGAEKPMDRLWEAITSSPPTLVATCPQARRLAGAWHHHAAW